MNIFKIIQLITTLIKTVHLPVQVQALIIEAKKIEMDAVKLEAAADKKLADVLAANKKVALILNILTNGQPLASLFYPSFNHVTSHLISNLSAQGLNPFAALSNLTNSLTNTINSISKLPQVTTSNLSLSITSELNGVIGSITNLAKTGSSLSSQIGLGQNASADSITSSLASLFTASSSTSFTTVLNDLSKIGVPGSLLIPLYNDYAAFQQLENSIKAIYYKIAAIRSSSEYNRQPLITVASLISLLKIPNIPLL